MQSSVNVVTLNQLSSAERHYFLYKKGGVIEVTNQKKKGVCGGG
jgi:hypothetical protein